MALVKREGGRFSIAPIFRAHLGALADAETQQVARRTAVWLVSAPVAVGAFFAVLVGLGVQTRDGVSQALAAVALLVGAMLSLFVFITNLRVKVQESATYAFRVRFQRLLGGIAASCLYVAIGSMFVAAQLVAVASLQILRSDSVLPYTVGVVVASVTHLFMTLMSLVRRLFAVYYELFAADFDPVPQVISEAVDGENEWVDRSSRARNP